jgi:SAM-dependent methyltransferase
MTTTTPVDFVAVKQRQRAAWSTGDYAVIGTTLQIIGESLCETVDVAAGWRVLDVAAGNGNAALAAARRGCEVTASDYVPELLERLRARAAADGVAVETRTDDAEALDLLDASFDAVLSTLGVMFAPHQEQAAAELIRVCRPGGRIGLANWTPDSFVGRMFRTIGRYAPPPAGVRSPLEWGTETRLRELFGNHVSTLDIAQRHFVFRHRSAAEFIDTMRAYYGPMAKAFGSLDDDGRTALATDLVELAEDHNAADDGTLRLPSAYLEVVAHRAS